MRNTDAVLTTPRFILRILPIEVACYASKEEISKAIKPLVEQYFPVETQTPHKVILCNSVSQVVLHFVLKMHSKIDRIRGAYFQALWEANFINIDLLSYKLSYVQWVLQETCVVNKVYAQFFIWLDTLFVSTNVKGWICWDLDNFFHVQFAVLYEARANTGIDRMEIIDAVAKSVPAPHKVDLSNPDKTIVVEIARVRKLCSGWNIIEIEIVYYGCFQSTLIVWPYTFKN